MDDISLKIYYLSPYDLMLYPVSSVEDLIQRCEKKFVIHGKDKEEKLLDYDGEIGVTVRDNLLLVKKNESYVGEGDEEEVYWGKDTVFVKKLW